MAQQDTNTKREEKLYELVGTAQTVNKQLTETNTEFVEILNSYREDLNDIKDNVSEIKERLGKE